LRFGEGENLRWKVELPGSGTSTPIVWENQVFVLTAIPADAEVKPGASEPREQAQQDGRGRRGGGRGRGADRRPQRFTVLSYACDSGKLLWQKVARQEAPHEGHHGDHGYASYSPVTDGKRLFVSFGSRGIYSFSLAGEKNWEVDLGDMRTRNGFGEGSSPALHGDTLVVNWDQESGSFVAALDARSGKVLWKKDRDEVTSWTTPLILEVDGKPQAIINGAKRARGYDLTTGALIWECGGQTENVIPTPVHGHGLVYLISGFRGAALQAVRLGKSGDLTGSAEAIAWSLNRDTPYVPSPVLSGERLYFLSGNKGILSCLDARSGKAHYQAQRLDDVSGVYASPIAAAGRIYLVGRRGELLVLKDSERFEALATGRLGEDIDASPVAVGEDLLLRGHRHLFCFTEGGKG
jgi:outer membrane protein assembly factor BamB